MTDPLRSDRPPSGGDVPDRDRDARIEDLLLSGLTHYFAGQHELAINVWTRVLFIDRGHARARAYIERARSAVAERQRQGEELLHGGRVALDRGDAGQARKLVASAVEHGAAPEDALAVLARIDRLESASHAPAPSRLRLEPEPAAQPSRARTGSGRRWYWIAAGMLGLAGASVAGRAVLRESGLWPMASRTPVSASSLLGTSIPLPTAAEVALSRAEALFSRGRLHEALLSLEAVPAGDPLRPQADELTTRIQKQLLAAARDEAMPSQASDRRP